MAVVSALVFVSALALIVAVFIGTLLPSWRRIVVALAGEPTPQPRVVLTPRAYIVRSDRRMNRPGVRLSEAA